MKKNSHFKKTQIAATLILIASMVLTSLSPQLGVSGVPFVPAGYQLYYVLGDSTKIVKQAIDIATAFPPATAQPYSVVSLVSYQDRARVYIDQKANGYTFNPADFTGADAVFELDKGGVLTLDNWAAPYYSIVPVGEGSLLSGALGKVDGGDYIYIAGGPVNMVRGVTDRQSGTGPDGNFITDMWSVFPVEQGGPTSQMHYIVPVGENTPGTGDFNGTYQRRGGTYFVVQATEDGTSVDYTVKGVPHNQALSRGESFIIQHVWKGDTVDSNKKVQVGMIASGRKEWDVRFFSLQAAATEGSDFWIPTFPSGFPAMNIRFHIYAFTDATVTIVTKTGIAPGWNGKPLTAGTVDTSFTTTGQTPVHIFALEGQMIIILVSIDTGSGDRDWGYEPTDSKSYGNDYYIPYAPSGLRSNQDEQLYVTPIFDGTTIYVDYNQDGVVDDSVTLNRLEAHGFYNPSIMDNTGAHLWSDFPFTVVYGESSYADIGGNLAGYDWGYTLIPTDATNFNTALKAVKSADPPVVVVSGTVTYEIVVNSEDVTINRVNVTDTLPPGFTYNPGTTTITHPDASQTHEDPSVSGPILTWSLEETLSAHQTLTVVFNATASSTPGVNYLDLVVAEGKDPFGNILSPEAMAFVTVSAASIVSGTLMDVTEAIPVPVPGVTVWLYNGTSDALLKTTQTDGNGFYKFIDLAPGDYYVKYDSLDPDMGYLVPYSDDDPSQPPADPLVSSAVFTLPPASLHTHDFEAILPVDLAIVKTGPATAIHGEKITYTYNVTNLGLTGAKDVQVLDDICGAASYVSGDVDHNTMLDPGEEWMFQCTHIVKTTDVSPLVNKANVTTTSLDTDPSNNEDDWSVRLLVPGIKVEKTLTQPPGGVVAVDGTVKFNVKITNTGEVPLVTVPLSDTYDPAKLDYQSATTAPDSVDEVTGTLGWNDLTGAGELAPGGSVQVEVAFKALAGAYPDPTIDTAEVVDALAKDGSLLGGSAYAGVLITAPVGGEVLEPDLTAMRAVLMTLMVAMVLAAALILRRPWKATRLSPQMRG